jgi:hypothetical protein
LNWGNGEELPRCNVTYSCSEEGEKRGRTGNRSERTGERVRGEERVLSGPWVAFHLPVY